MRQLLFAYILIFLGLSCKNSKSNQTQGNLADSVFTYNDKFIKIDTLSKAGFEKYTEFDFQKFINKSELNKTINDTLKFKIDSVTTTIFTDTLTNTDGPEIRKNEHIGNILDYYIVQTHLYESSDFTLVNKKNGYKYSFISEPYLSPNSKYLLSICASIEYAVASTGIQVWKVQSERLFKKVDLDTRTKGFQIEEIRWITDDDLAVKIGFGTGQNAYGLMKIK